ncbi:UNVERIFIED_ORG: hypothetical protein ABIC43_006659 [Variovorax guangxiensis]
MNEIPSAASGTWKTQWAAAIAAKLDEPSRQHDGRELKRLDAGVFPWHASIELSLLCVTMMTVCPFTRQ